MTERTIEQKALSAAILELEDPIGEVRSATDALRMIANGADCEATRSALRCVQGALERATVDLNGHFFNLHTMLGGAEK